MGGKGWREAGGGGTRRVARARTRISLLPNIRSNAFLNEVSAAFPISTASASATLDSHALATPDASPGNFLDEGTSRPRTRGSRASLAARARAHAPQTLDARSVPSVSCGRCTPERARPCLATALRGNKGALHASRRRAHISPPGQLVPFRSRLLAQRFRHRRNTALPLVRSSAEGLVAKLPLYTPPRCRPRGHSTERASSRRPPHRAGEVPLFASTSKPPRVVERRAGARLHPVADPARVGFRVTSPWLVSP